jgi:hypothetical protein
MTNLKQRRKPTILNISAFNYSNETEHLTYSHTNLHPIESPPQFYVPASTIFFRLAVPLFIGTAWVFLTHWSIPTHTNNFVIRNRNGIENRSKF